jgi:TPR repeat protein
MSQRMRLVVVAGLLRAGLLVAAAVFFFAAGAAGADARADDEFVPDAVVAEIPPAERGTPIDCPRFADPELRAVCDRANDGDVLATLGIAQAMLVGLGAERDIEGARVLLQRAARFGNPDAALLLGTLYDSGDGVAADPRMAVRYYRFAAREGRAAADFALGLIYEEGRDGVPQDLAEAAQRYRGAADAGHGAAQLFLGRMYRDGRGVPADEEQATQRFRDALDSLTELAESGNAESHYLIGTMYLQGEGVPRDPHQATEELLAAAADGSREAASLMGDLYDEGRGVEQDRDEALRYWEMALDRDDAPADDLNRVAWRLAEQRSELDHALRWARRAVALAPQDGNIRDTLAWILFRQGVRDEALREQQRAVAQMPECWECLDHLGDMYAAADRSEEARDAWRRALTALEATSDNRLEHPREELRMRVTRKLGD